MLGPALRSWRALHRVKQAHAAEILGVSQAQVSRWESGTQRPNERQARALAELLSARLSSAADMRLARFVTEASTPIHLVCDISHKLLAYSKARAKEFRAPASDIEGMSLWASASEEIVGAERRLGELGWYDAVAPVLEFETDHHVTEVIDIPRARFAWTRFRLSDGRHVRLVETLSAP
ncbi:helix-turn-helix transcriptional regulator [Afifella pfennigii]|uniref:helix-turn-helix transcriptional regulator n=1 Tax=Afifella pfennigii TaxID=209897 RepID=UPI0024801558|nr:helix-turn-helix transcriptional regulator [Afifella pfennigii]